MKKIKVMSIFGTRPEAVKMAPVVRALENDSSIDSLVCVTAQHREMLDQVLDLFKITPDYDLDIMKPGQTLTQITSRVLLGLEEVLQKEKPDMVLVHGDTTTTFTASLAAFYNGIKVGHVEAGLRSYDKLSPFPEEINRNLTGKIADIHFAPTDSNVNNLLKESVDINIIKKTGNTVIDALMNVVEEDYKFENELLNEIDYENKKVVLLTAHRRENLGTPMENIFKAVAQLAQENEDVEVIFPVHLNPKIREIASKFLNGVERVHMIEPLEYEPFTNLMARSYLILTDSGGIQEEAPSLGKPVLVLRTETERPEAIKAGTVKLVGTQYLDIYKEAKLLINNKSEYEKMAFSVNPYGDGKASERIVEEIKIYFN